MTAAPDCMHPEPDPLEASLVFLAQTIDDLSEQVPTGLASADGAAACLLLHALRAHRQELARIEATVEADVARRLGKGVHEVDGFAVEVRGGSTWKDWRHDDVAWTLCRPLAVDQATGEIDGVKADVVDAVRSLLLNAARPSWRLVVLRQHGINPADYATWEAGRRTVQIAPRAEELS